MLGKVDFDSGDFVNARKWYERMIEVGGCSDEETFLAMFRIAESNGGAGDAMAPGRTRIC